MMRNLSQTEHFYHRLIAVLLAFFSFGMSAYLSDAVFERLPHIEDEMAYLFEARIIARGNLVIETPTPGASYWQPFVIDHEGTRFGKYTPGFPALLAIGVILGQEWVVNAFFAALAVAVVYRLGREVFSPDVGVFAAALTAFSPMALLLNATLMGHTTALFSTVLFVYAYWRVERGKNALRWGVIAGIALGMLVSNRPLTGIAVAVPFVAWSGVRLLRAVLSRPRSEKQEAIGVTVGASHDSPLHAEAPKVEAGTLTPQPSLHHLLATLKPLVALAIPAILISLSIPLFNYQAVGDPTENLYTLVWSYDRVGYGEGYGRNGHTLEKGVRHMRFDLSLMAADLFGWQLQGRFVPTADNGSEWQPYPMIDATGELSFEVKDHLLFQSDYYPLFGISWILLPFGLIVAYRQWSLLVALWLFVGLAILALPFLTEDINHVRDPQIAWLVVITLMLWLLAPLLVMKDRQAAWTWLIVSVALSLLITHLTYWIGSQRYSTRYYFEALPAFALITALPLAWLANRRKLFARPVVFGLFGAVLAWSLFYYSLPRISVLKEFNLISRDLIEAVEARREGDRPVLVIVTGDNVRWRSYGALMAVTSPYLDSPIVAARSSSSLPREEILSRFEGWQVIDMLAEENQSWFADEQPPAVG
ncbi:MAG TPA: glycosyltransferase family 39 protein [Oceanobacillus sp.]|nr:glycosyltransferase family 39 protein [Oceanobacillus sp.]